MTFRHQIIKKSLLLGSQTLALVSVSHAQTSKPDVPSLSPARAVASHITPARPVVRTNSQRELLVASPTPNETTVVVPTPSPTITHGPVSQAVVTVPVGAKSIITAPLPTPPRPVRASNPAASKPTAVPFVPAPGSEPVYPGEIAATQNAIPASKPVVALAPKVEQKLVSPETKPALTPVTKVQPVESKPAEAKPATPRLAAIRAEQAAKPEPKKADNADRVLLARLESDLNEASRRLDRARGRISAGQRQLAQFADVLQEVILEAGSDAKGLNPFVRVAQRYRGTPYVWGGVSARGFDCSGFIIRVMQDLGYRALPHSAAEQFRYGMPVAEPLLKPGDIVFFANTYKPGVSHVGIYLGKRRFIHAANSQVGTIVSSLDESKWRAKYAGARRLVPVKS